MTTIICEECKAEVPEASEYCPECGFPFENRQSMTCPVCLKQVVFVADSCSECGYTLVREESDVTAVSDSVSLEESDAVEGAVAQVSPREEAVSPTQDVPPVAADDGATETAGEPAEQELRITAADHDKFGEYVREVDRQLSALAEAMKETLGESEGRQRNALLNIQEAITALSRELDYTATAMKEANSATVAEISAAIKQAAVTAAPPKAQEPPAKSGEMVDYVFYACIAMLFFTILNLFVTVYAVRLIK
jgi:hypothetical protein